MKFLPFFRYSLQVLVLVLLVAGAGFVIVLVAATYILGARVTNDPIAIHGTVFLDGVPRGNSRVVVQVVCSGIDGSIDRFYGLVTDPNGDFVFQTAAPFHYSHVHVQAAAPDGYFVMQTYELTPPRTVNLALEMLPENLKSHQSARYQHFTGFQGVRSEEEMIFVGERWPIKSALE
jgi:hypothetical protein